MLYHFCMSFSFNQRILLHTVPSLHDEILLEDLFMQFGKSESDKPATSFDTFKEVLSGVYPSAIDFDSIKDVAYVHQKSLPSLEDKRILFQICSDEDMLTKDLCIEKKRGGIWHVSCIVLEQEIKLKKLGLLSECTSDEDLNAVLEGIKLQRYCSGWKSGNADCKTTLLRMRHPLCSVLLPFSHASAVCDACCGSSPGSVIKQFVQWLKHWSSPETFLEFMQDQLLHAVNRIFKWSPVTLDMCAEWVEEAPKVYDKWRQLKFLHLPHPGSLKQLSTFKEYSSLQDMSPPVSNRLIMLLIQDWVPNFFLLQVKSSLRLEFPVGLLLSSVSQVNDEEHPMSANNAGKFLCCVRQNYQKAFCFIDVQMSMKKKGDVCCLLIRGELVHFCEGYSLYNYTQ
jgi:hypothetical protein